MVKQRLVSFFLLLAVVVVCAGAIIMTILTDSGWLSIEHPLQQAREGQVRVACVGDSLTYGFGIPDRAGRCYPTQLQNALGDGYCVNNYGFSGRTASRQGDRPYTAEALYTESLAFDADIVVIMLGSNDTKDFNWVSDEHYLEEYRLIIDSYMAKDNLEALVLMAPTPVFAKHGTVPYGINQSLIERLPVLCTQLYNELLPAAAQKGIALRLVNLYPLFEGRAELFSDGAHPTAEGAAIIAKTVCKTIKAL